MVSINRLTIAWKLVLAAGLAIGLLLLAAAAAVSAYSRDAISDLNRRYADAVAVQAIGQVQAEVAASAAAARALGGAIGAAHEAGQVARPAYVAMVKPGANVSGAVMGAWFMAEPNAIDGQDAGFANDAATASNKDGRLSIYWVNHNGDVKLEPQSDGTDFQEAYYSGPAASGRPTLTEPYVETVGGASVSMTSVAYPVRSNGKLIGVAGLDMSLSNLSTALGALHPLGGGRVMLVSAQGKWIAHPDAAVRMTAYADPGADAVTRILAKGAGATIKGVMSGGKSYERLLRPVNMAGLDATWVLVVDVPTAAITGSADRMALALLIGGLAITAIVLVILYTLSGALVRRPLASLTSTVRVLGQGRYDSPVPGVGRGDEIGAIATALEGFRHDLADGERRRTEQEQERAAAEAERNAHAASTLAHARSQAGAVASLGQGLATLAQGDLTWSMSEADFTTDTRQIPRDFNAAVDTLSEVMRGIHGSAVGIRQGCADISSATDDLSLRTERQAAGLEQTAAALDQITVTVTKSAEGAIRAREVTAIAKDAAMRSGQVVSQAVDAMGGIEQSSREITQIISVIDEIAFQTNLLALNAGVEAARAGESGKGFAVVAQEVRALAQRSADAAKQIKALIQSSTGQVERGVGLVAQTGEALREILGQVDEINELVGEIAASAREQATGIAEINTAVNHMDQVTQQNAAMVEQTSAASSGLADEAGELERLIARFKVPGAPPAVAPPARAPARVLRAATAGGGAAAFRSGQDQDGWEEF